MKVKWDQEEEEAVIAETVQLRLQNVSAPLVALINKAQRTKLPNGRHRTIKTVCTVPEIVRKIQERLLEQVTNPSSNEPPFVFERIVKEPLPSPDKLATTIPTKWLVAEIVDRVLKFVDRIPHLPTKRDEPVTHYYTESQPAAIRLPKVAIVGLLPHQEEFILQKLRGAQLVIELLFLNKDYQPKVPPSVHYVIYQKHTGHNWWEKIKAKIPSENIVFVDGTNSGVLKAINDLNSRVNQQV